MGTISDNPIRFEFNAAERKEIAQGLILLIQTLNRTLDLELRPDDRAQLEDRYTRARALFDQMNCGILTV